MFSDLYMYSRENFDSIDVYCGLTFLPKQIGYKIRKGWNINVDARSIHLDTVNYNDPNEFNPSRFDVSLFVPNPVIVSIASKT